MAFHGVDLNVRVEELMCAFRNQVRARGGSGIRNLAVIFRRMDTNGNKKLDIYEFEQALKSFGLFPKIVDLQGLHKYFDIDGDGNIGYEEFIRAMKEPLSPMARDFVLRAFSQLDRDGSGVATIKDIAHLYDVSENADFLDGIKTRDEILGDFLNSFDGLRGNADGQISQEEFLDYYSDLRAAIPSDEYFCRMLESTWGMAHEDASGEFRDHLKHILHLFRQRLITLSNGSQEEYKLKQLFDQFDLNRNQVITMDELAALMAKLGISVERKYLSALIGAIDRNANGGIEFQEFRNFIIYDPYK